MPRFRVEYSIWTPGTITVEALDEESAWDIALEEVEDLDFATIAIDTEIEIDSIEQILESEGELN